MRSGPAAGRGEADEQPGAYGRIDAAGKPKKVALNAVIRTSTTWQQNAEATA